MNPSKSLSGETEAKQNTPTPASWRASADSGASWRINRWVALGFACSVSAQLFNNTKIAVLMLAAGMIGLLVDLWSQRR